MTRYPTRPLFDVVMGAIVPTMEAGNEDQRDALAAMIDAPEPRPMLVADVRTGASVRYADRTYTVAHVDASETNRRTLHLERAGMRHEITVGARAAVDVLSNGAEAPAFTRRFGTFGGDYWHSWREVHGVELNAHEFDVLLTVAETCAAGNARDRARHGGWSDGPDYTGQDAAYYWLAEILLASATKEKDCCASAGLT
jgi:hypothetical protein